MKLFLEVALQEELRQWTRQNMRIAPIEVTVG
jgi:hypothetical protein